MHRRMVTRRDGIEVARGTREAERSPDPYLQMLQ